DDGTLAEQDGINLKHLHRMSSDTWIYEGDLEFQQPVHLRANLVVMGKFVCGEASLLEGDIRARSIEIGAVSLCKGNLVAERDLLLGRRVTFQGVIHAGASMRLARGVRGFNVGHPVVAFAGGRLAVEPNVVVNGKLASNEYVQAVFGASM
ncbi:MAG: polymer-forming cytoskeletal protein, partial [Acidobacteria bacterium]|nr:polymer-forming cytoskeletal protein [Acidobacteriota bacterium]